MSSERKDSGGSRDIACCAGSGPGDCPDPRRSAFPVERLVALGQALADPIRVRMLGLMAAGRCCGALVPVDVPIASDDENAGICVCEFMATFSLGQSKASYHLRKLKEAGLVREEPCGKWNFYSIDRQAVLEMLAELAAQLGVAIDAAPAPAGASGCAGDTQVGLRLNRREISHHKR